MMLELASRKVLVIAPHPDDEVFGCGGLIHRVKSAGGQVHVLYMTVGTTRDFSSRGRSTGQERIAELERVVKRLEIDSYEIAFPGDDHHLQLDALPQKALIHAVERGFDLSLENLRPDLVLTTPVTDYNQDHRAVGAATLAALRPGSVHKSLSPVVLTYELPVFQWNLAPALPGPHLLVRLEPADLGAKLGALECYRSQLKDPDCPLSLRGVEALARLRGMACGAPAAEAFQIERLIL